MTLEFKIILIAIIIEVSLISTLILLFYAAKLIAVIRNKQHQRFIKEIEGHLTHLVTRNMPFNQNHFKRNWQKLDILLSLIEKFDTKYPVAAWENIKPELIRAIILPLARENAISKDWVKRLLATKGLTYLVEKKDEYLLLKLINDQIPIVYEYAILATVQFKSAVCINEVITKIAEERRLSQAIALKFFESASPQIKSIVVERLEEDKNPYIRATCYKILLKFPALPLNLNSIVDITSQNLELALAALRFLVYTEKQKAIAILIDALGHRSWEMRAVAARELGILQAQQAVKELARSIHDSQWWVRVNAAEALKKLGNEGMQVLKTQSIISDKFAYETAQYILNLPS